MRKAARHPDLTEVLSGDESGRELTRYILAEGSNLRLHGEAFERLLAVACDPRISLQLRLARINVFARAVEILRRELEEQIIIHSKSANNARD